MLELQSKITNMETKRTNKDLLFKGIKTMLLAAVLMFAGPTLLYIGLSNEDKPLYFPLLVTGSIVCILAIFFAFKGLRTIMDSMFKN